MPVQHETDEYVVIERGATGLPGVHGPFGSREKAESVVRDWSWTRWTKSVEIGTLGSPRHAAYSNTRPGWDYD